MSSTKELQHRLSTAHRGEVVVTTARMTSRTDLAAASEREEETSENFYEEHGKRWFRTGDIGTFDNDGVLRIIDRKKDLVKLQHGEYVSYGRTESVLKTAPIVEQICAYADPTRDFIVAVVIPERKTLAEICPEDSLQECCGDKEIQAEVVRQLKEYGTKNGLKAFEIPARVLLGISVIIITS